jgi:hypothetical protein
VAVVLVVGCLLEEEAGGGAAEFLAGLADGGQRDGGGRREVDVLADDRDIVRHPDVVAGHLLQLARLIVAVTEDDRQSGLVRLILDPRATSVKNGLATSSTTRPIVRLRPARSWRADSFLTKPSSVIAACTRTRVGAATISGRLMTLETVATETPAWAATSLMLTGPVHQLLKCGLKDSLRTGIGTCQTRRAAWHGFTGPAPET